MNNVHAILLVVLSMLGFTIEDMFIKRLSGGLPVGQILILLGLGSGTVFAVMAKMQGHAIFAPRAWRPVFLLRAAAEASAAVSFSTALSLVDISVVAAVFQATPLAITMGAALFLGEQVGWRRWSAILAGFTGVLMIIRPGFDGFEPAALLVIVSVLSVALRDLLTRVIDSAVPSSVVSFQAFASVVLAGAAMLFFGSEPAQALQGGEWGMIAGGVAFGVMSYYGIVTAMRIGDASAVTPFRYTRLVFSILAGILMFGERPDAITLAGAALIIGSGLYTFLRERSLARRAAAGAAALAA